MSLSLKEMIVVLGIAAVIFTLAKPIALRFSTKADFSRRRNVWYALTAAAFLSPNFWLFALLAIPLMTWAGRKDTNPVAFYLLLFQVIPSIPIEIPVFGINKLFELDNYRLLSFCVLVPAAWRLRRSKTPERIHGLQAMDLLLLAYGVLQTALFIPPDLPGHVLLHDSFTNVLRRAFLFLIDVYVLYFVVSRSCSSRRAIIEAQAAFCLACGVMAAVGVFEELKHWLLYADFAKSWIDDPRLGFYLFRGDNLRAQASAGHALALGYMLAVAFGFWLYLRSHVQTARSRIGVALLLWLGLLAAYSRGPWFGAAAIYFAFVTLSPRAFPRLFRAVGIVVILVAVISVTPLARRITNVLPFMGGSVDVGTIDYRDRVIEQSWQIIQQHPFFGDQEALFKMEDLRQGEGIIDVVNTYAGIALNKGFVGLGIFVCFILIAVAKAYRPTRRVAKSDPDLALLGVSLVACILGTLLMLENCSFILAYEKMFYVLAGLAAAYAYLHEVPVAHAQTGVQSQHAWAPR
jgi:O-antigen ligase